MYRMIAALNRDNCTNNVAFETSLPTTNISDHNIVDNVHMYYMIIERNELYLNIDISI